MKRYWACYAIFTNDWAQQDVSAASHTFTTTKALSDENVCINTNRKHEIEVETKLGVNVIF